MFSLERSPLYHSDLTKLEDLPPFSLEQSFVNEAGNHNEPPDKEEIQNSPTKRTSNYIFKTPLSIFFTVCLSLKKKRKKFYQMINEVYGTKNLRTFPKLLIILKFFDYESQVAKEWNQQIKESSKENYDEAKYEEICLWSDRITAALQQKDLQSIFYVYNGCNDKNKKKKVYKQGLKQVKRFAKNLKNL